jgi:predicted DNA-binding transcriptional regulator AlpA
MTRSALARQLGCSRTTLWNLENRGVIPTPVRISGNRTIFDLEATMAAEAAVMAGWI